MLGKARDFAVLHINLKRGRDLGQTRHAHDGTRRHNHKARTGIKNEARHRQRKALRGTELFGVRGKGEGGFGDTDGELVKTKIRDAL